MPEIKLKIEGKIVSQVGDNPPIVCGNDDYECVVEFDEEWSGRALKVAKIIWNGIYEEVTFGGDRFTLPKVFNTTKVKVGFYSGDLRTTTGVTLGALKSINDENPRHEEEPSEDIVNRILRLIEEGAIQGPQGIQGTPGFFISDYSANPPVPGLIHGFKIEDLYPPMEPKVGELIMSYGNFGIYRVEAVMNGGCIGRCTGSFRGDDGKGYAITDEDRAEIARVATELITKQSLGLGNVDNTADADKPISKAADSRFKKIEEKIPATASASNPLTDTNTVVKMISDRIVDFKGTFAATNLLPMGGVTDGDLAFVTRTDADGNDILDLYMFDGSRRIWVKKTEIYSNKFTAEDFVRIRNAYVKPQNGIPDDDLERDLKERIGYVDPNGTLIDSDVDLGYLQDNIAGLGYVHLPNMIEDAEYSIVVTGKDNFRFEGTGFARENNPIEAVFHNYIIVDNEGCVFVYGSEFPPENAPYHVKLTGPKIIHQKYNPLQTVRDGTAGFTTEMGKDTVATGSFAVAEGWETEATNEFAHAMGNHTKAKAAASLAAGMYTETEDTAMAGMAQGYRTIATGAFQHVEGRYNVRDNEGRYAHIVGAGVADNDRENIEAIDWDGNKKIRGDVYAHANADSSGGDKLTSVADFIEAYDASKTYTIGDIMLRNNKTYRAKKIIYPAHAFAASDWDEIDFKDALDITIAANDKARDVTIEDVDERYDAWNVEDALKEVSDKFEDGKDAIAATKSAMANKGIGHTGPITLEYTDAHVDWDWGTTIAFDHSAASHTVIFDGTTYENVDYGDVSFMYYPQVNKVLGDINLKKYPFAVLLQAIEDGRNSYMYLCAANGSHTVKVDSNTAKTLHIVDGEWDMFSSPDIHMRIPDPEHTNVQFTFDGVDYDLPPQYVDGNWYWGNTSFISEDMEDSGEPFVLVWYSSDWPCFYSKSGDHVVEYTGVVPIDLRNLSDRVEAQGVAAGYTHGWRLYDSIRGEGSMSIGYNNTSAGYLSFASGYMAKAIANYSTAIGYQAEATGRSSIAIGQGAKATNGSAIALGNANKAYGAYSFATGASVTASGSSSSAFGAYTKASSNTQHAQGKYNVEDKNGVYADIVGWGTADNARKNIEATTVEGDKKLKGSVYVECADDSTGGKKLATEEYVNTQTIFEEYTAAEMAALWD